MKVEMIKKLLGHLEILEMDRTEFMFEFKDYLNKYEGSNEVLEQWLLDVNTRAKDMEKLTSLLYLGLREDRRDD